MSRADRQRTARALLSTLAGLALVLASTLACRLSQSPVDVDNDELCREIGYSISNRTLSCTGDSDLARRRYHQFRDEFACPDPATLAPPPDAAAPDASDAGTTSLQLDCAEAVFTLSCDQVTRLGDDLEAWMESQPPCVLSVASKTGKKLNTPCPEGSTDCGQGVCIAIVSDVFNCGACGKPCPAEPPPGAQNQQRTCTEGQCGFACLPDFADCNGDPADGCEANLVSDLAHCGACGTSCATGAPNTAGACVDKVCTSGCNPGYLDCDGDPATGCETPSDDKNCFGCGNACNGGGTADAVCDPALGSCRLIAYCAPGTLNCDTIAPGCETTSTVEQCANCGLPCPAAAHAQPECVGSECRYTCDPGYLDCDSSPATGCEAKADEVTSCAGCLAFCPPPPPNALRECNQGKCGVACSPGWLNCNQDLSDGCEVKAQQCP